MDTITMDIEESVEEEPISITVEEEKVFDKKAKPKRVLTDAQKDALQKGREKAKATREAKKREMIKKELELETKKAGKLEIKKEREQLKKVEEQASNDLKAKRQKKTAQEKARERIKIRKAERDKQEQKKIDEYNELKYTCLGNCDTEEDFEKVDDILNKYITKSDILKGNDFIREKVGKVVELLKK